MTVPTASLLLLPLFGFRKRESALRRHGLYHLGLSEAVLLSLSMEL